MNTTKSVEEICQLIEQYKLMSSKDYAVMRGRWFRPDRKEVADAEEFRKWLVLNRYLTDFVARVLWGRKSDQLVLNQYRLQDQMISGPMAGAYLAHDALDRPVAIEVLSSSGTKDQSVLTRFQQVALKAMEVQHPNVARILDAGEAHGLHYLVKEYSEGPTLDDVLQRRGKLPYLQATRLLALALAGLEALHAHGVPAGDLTADCLLLAAAGKGASSHRTVKILHAGVRRCLFDETAIGRSISIVQGIPDGLELAASCTFQLSDAGAAVPADDIFRLGCIAYRCVTGRAPFAERDLPLPSRPAPPVAEAAPEVPEMLCQIIEQMIDPDPARRPQKAAHVAKSLRVFLAAEEHARGPEAEEQIVSPTEKAAAEPAAEEPEDEADQEEPAEEAPAPRRLGRTKAPVSQDAAWGKALALWQEVRPDLRDLLFLAGGALGMLLVLLLGHLLTGLPLSLVAGLFMGMAVTYCVELFLRWRRRQSQGVSE